MPIDIVPNEELPQPDTQPSLLDFASQLPETAEGFGATPADAGKRAAESDDDERREKAERKRKRVQVSKRMRKTVDKMKANASNFPVLWFNGKASADHPEWKLNETEEAVLRDSIETVFDLFDIEIEFEPIVAHITSVWWLLCYPALVFTLLFATKKIQTGTEGPTDAT